jgi:ferrous iron transport protein B
MSPFRYHPQVPPRAVIDDRAPDEQEIILCGNPNAGKSTIFNLLTGGHAHIANYPGVTVEVKHGHTRMDGRRFVILDTPGIYSLSARTEDEIVTESILLGHHPAACIQVVDASNLARDLYLTLELLELGYRPVLLLNKWDLVRSRRLDPSVEALERFLGVKCFAVSAKDPHSLAPVREFLAQVAPDAAARTADAAVEIDYGPVLEPILREAEITLAERGGQLPSPLRFAALRMLTCGLGRGPHRGGRGRGRRMRHGGGPPCEECGEPGGGWRRHLLLKAREACESQLGQEPAEVAAVQRHAYIHQLLETAGFPAPDTTTAPIPRQKLSATCACIDTAFPSEKQTSPPASHPSRSDRIDRWLLHPVVGYLAFIAGLWLMFQATFTLGAPLVNLLEIAVSWLAVAAKSALAFSPFLASLIGEGIIPGVGLVLVFLPNILILFLALALLEDSGYLSRGALLTDGILRRFGLSGRSFIPMVVAFGCNVPAILAARTMPTFKDRLITIAVIPWMSCSARLPVYILLAGAFFPARWGGTVILSMYLLGVVVAILAAKLLRKAVAGEVGELLVELPDYRMPRLVASIQKMWSHTWHYVHKAGTIILLAAVIVWFLFSFPQTPQATARAQLIAAGDNPTAEAISQAQVSRSYAGRIGRAVEPVFAPMGFDWRVAVGLVGAAVAKEVMVSTMGVVYGVGEGVDAGSQRMVAAVRERSGLTPLTGLALMVFALFYLPCLPTLGVIYRELQSLRWTAAIVGLHLATAYVLALVVVLIGRLMGLR